MAIENDLFLCGGAAKGSKPCSLDFHRGSELQELDHRGYAGKIDIREGEHDRLHVARRLQHEDAGALAGFHKAVGAQRCDGLADDGAADAVRLGQRASLGRREPGGN
jgi:hypothetical protein